MMSRNEIIQKHYVRVAKAYNNLDYTEIEAIAADNVRYSSQNVLEELEGKEEVLNYLKGKFKAVRESSSPVFAEMAVMSSQGEWTIQISDLKEGDPCVLLAQGSKTNKGAIILILVNDQSKVSAINICTVVPHWSTAIGSDIYPT